MQLIIIQLNGKLIMRKVSWILFKIIILFYRKREENRYQSSSLRRSAAKHAALEMRLSDRSVRETLHIDLNFVENDGRTGTRDVTLEV